MVDDDLVELAKYFQIFDDVRIFVGYEHQKKLLNRYIDIADYISLDMCALPSRLDQLWKVRHVLLHLKPVNCDKLACNQNFT